MKKTTVTIGIAAYNEERNIASLVRSLLSQEQKHFLLQRIIVVSDGSTDNTISEVRKIRNKKVTLLSHKIRQGKSAALNQILKKATCDVLVFMDADVVMKDKRFLGKLIYPIMMGQTDVAASKVMELPVKNTFQKMLLLSMTIKKDIFELYNNGNNIYTCHGRALALSKKIYTKLQFPKGIIADDAYIFLFCMKQKYKYQYVREAKVYYALPTNIEDHQKQSHRFLSTQKQLYKIFGKTTTIREYHLPVDILVKVVLRYLLKNPMLLLHYGLVYAKSKIKSFMHEPTLAHWETAHSSKTI